MYSVFVRNFPLLPQLPQGGGKFRKQAVQRHRAGYSGRNKNISLVRTVKVYTDSTYSLVIKGIILYISGTSLGYNKKYLFLNL
jgi:LEA14-like dessication related protein